MLALDMQGEADAACSLYTAPSWFLGVNTQQQDNI
jgi:hypothetical protein